MFRQQSFRWPPNLFISALGFPEILKKVYRSRFLHANVSGSQIVKTSISLTLSLFWCSLNYNISVSVAAEKICPDFLWHLSKPRKRFFLTLAGICPSGMKLIFSN